MDIESIGTLPENCAAQAVTSEGHVVALGRTWTVPFDGDGSVTWWGLRGTELLRVREVALD